MADKWYVHYLVGSGFVPAQKCVAGPYTEAEALTKRQELARVEGNSDVHVSDLASWPV